MSATSKKRAATAAYEHVNGIYGGCLENSDVFDPKQVRLRWVLMQLLNLRSETSNPVTYDGFNI